VVLKTNKNKDNVKVAFVSVFDEEQQILLKTTTSILPRDERVAGRERRESIFGAKAKAWKHKM